jgi:hypothetical protein
VNHDGILNVRDPSFVAKRPPQARSASKQATEATEFVSMRQLAGGIGDRRQRYCPICTVGYLRLNVRKENEAGTYPPEFLGREGATWQQHPHDMCSGLD